MEKEWVNHPAHYNAPGRKECIEEMIDIWGEEKTALWCEMTAYRYNYRAGMKDDNPEARDKAKEAWYLKKAKELYDVVKRKAEKARLNIKVIQDLTNASKQAENANDSGVGTKE